MSVKPDPAGDPGAKTRPSHRAFVFGNAALDETFQVQSLPASGESVLGQVAHTGLGGKGANQAIALCRTGVPTTLVAAVGTDWHSRAIRDALAREPLETVLIERPDLSSDRSVILAQRGGENLIVTTKDCARSISFAECSTVLARAQPGDMAFLQGNLDIDVTGAVARECRRRGLRLCLNPSPFDAAFAAFVPFADALFVNQPEALGLTGLNGADAVAALLQAGAGQVVLTLGVQGALLGAAGQVLHVPASEARVVDVTGAGDCFEGVAVGSALLRGTALDETALRHGSLAAAQAISRAGASEAFPSAARITALLGGQAPSDG